jgi:hypothetical protein
MAADRRASSIHRTSLMSGGTSDSIHSRPTSTSTSHFELRHPSNSFIVDSRRTSLALRRGSSGVIPPILQNDAFLPAKLELESPAMQREDHLSKMLSQMRMSSDFSLPAPSSSGPPPTAASGEEDLFLARKTSSIDFTDLELILARTRNPVLTHLHKTYQAQFDIMAQQITSLEREVDVLKSRETPPIQPYERQISLDVASTAPSESVRGGVRKSTQLSIPVPKRKSRQSFEQPFWKASLAGEDWDHGDPRGKRRGNIMRSISPMTMA